ncbi:MAG: DNA polymerase III subunit beta [Chloroflexi bacterium]|nr:DNA polymerase III subunit beta [Chloroflexota bacterium]MDA8189139.1 DNA polymerase III subunit beta [Dehalococcoidales bacterium]
MKVSCLQENLAKGLSIVGKAVATKSTLPTISNVLIETDDGRLKLAATNLEIAITCWVTAKIEENGAITVPAKLFSEFVNSLPNDDIEMVLNTRTRTLNVKCARYEANFKGIDAEEFPPIPKVSDTATCRVEPAVLEEAINQVVFAAATDDTRPVLAGVLASFDEEALTLAAADGFRLAVRRINLPNSASGKMDIIVPARALHEVARILGDQEEPVEVTVTPNRSQALFHMKDVELVSRLIEGSFPNYNQIIPKRHNTRTTIGTADFLKATRIASFFARDASNIVKLQATPGDELSPGKMVVAATSAETGDAVSGIDAIVEGEMAQIAFNAKYLSDVLSVLGCAQVALEISSPSSPGVVRPVGADNYTHVIMPMHTSR